MLYFLEGIILSLILWIICFFATGTDKKNIRYFSSYSTQVKNELKKNIKYKEDIKEKSLVKSFLLNSLLFGILFLGIGLISNSDDFFENFINIFILGQTINLFDFLVIDLIWWRNSKRVRFIDIPSKGKYKDVKPHMYSFIRATFMYSLIAIIDGIVLTFFCK